MLAGHGRCYFLITWGHAASILLIASLPYREMYKLPPLEVSLIDKSVFSCEAPRALQAQAVLLSAQRFPFSFLAAPLCCLLRCSTFFGARRCSRRQNTCMSRRFIFNSMDDCEPRAIGRCSFSLDMGSFAHQSTMPIQVVGCEPPLCRSCGPACGPARASIRAKSCFPPSPPCGSSRERSMSWGAGVPPLPQPTRCAQGTRQGMRPSI